MNTYRRRLPHRDAPSVPVFVTWRLCGSLPTGRSFQREHLTSGEAFVAVDRLLDYARTGPTYLRQPEIAGRVANQLREVAAGGLCLLHAWVLMPNHVHVLWTPAVSLPELLREVKGPTGRDANLFLGRIGEPFWQPEYFDRMVRSDGEFEQTRRYIEWNPVKAGLVTEPGEFPWSSASEVGRRG
jgi:REP element-mobilizing transposase RayT